MNNSFDLKEFREKYIGLTQKELAKALNVRQDMLSRIENNKSKSKTKTKTQMEQISLDLMMKISALMGVSIDTLVSYKKDIPKQINITSNWNKVVEFKSQIKEYIEDKKEEFQFFDIVDIFINANTNKPKIVFLGPSLAGKSTMINAILGKDILPTDMKPTTNITIYIKHIEDRPEYIKDNVLLIKKGSDYDGWGDVKLYDEKWRKKYIKTLGDIDILNTHNTKHNKNNDDVEIAILYIDSDLLKSCILIDTPGLSQNTKNKEFILKNIVLGARMLIFVSPITNFMTGEDCLNLKDALNLYKDMEKSRGHKESLLSKVYVVASKAHFANCDKDDMNIILENGYKNLINEIDKEFFENTNCKKEEFKNRFFLYTTNSQFKLLRKDFEQDFTDLIEQIPYLMVDNLKLSIKKFCDVAKKNADDKIRELEDIIENKDEYNPNSTINKFRREIIRQNSKKCIITRDTFEKKYNEIVHKEFILKLIDKEEIRGKFEDMSRLMTCVDLELRISLNEILLMEINDYISNLKDHMKDIDFEIKLSIERNVFKNLFKMIDDNIQLGIAHDLTRGEFGSFSGTWKDRTASTIIEIYNKKKVLQKYYKNIDNSWNNIDDFMNNEMDKLEEICKKNMENKEGENKLINRFMLDKTKELKGLIEELEGIVNNF